MLRLSSNITLILKIALPVLYATFFGMFVLSVFMIDTNFLLLSHPIFRTVLVIFYVLMITIIYFTFWRLRRVEYQAGHFYVSDYFKNYRYSIGDVASLKLSNLGVATIGKIILSGKGSLGKNIYFISKATNIQSFKEMEPHLFS